MAKKTDEAKQKYRKYLFFQKISAMRNGSPVWEEKKRSLPDDMLRNHS